MKPGAVLLNSSRGAILDETALWKALQNGHLSGAGLNVIDGEGSGEIPEHPLIR